MYTIEATSHTNVIPTTTTHIIYRLVFCMRLSRLIARSLRVAMCINSPDGLYECFSRVGRCNDCIVEVWIYVLCWTQFYRKEESLESICRNVIRRWIYY
jgi:hypothetical protein